MAKTVNLAGGPRGRKSLGLNLGLDPGERAKFRAAVSAGDLSSYFADKPATAQLFASKLGTPGISGAAAKYYATHGNFVPGGGTIAPPIEVPGAPTSGPAAPAAPDMTVDQLLGQTGGTLGPSATGINNYLQGRIKRLGDGPELPTFEDMFSRWLKIGQGEAKRQAAGITESFGARGARYGSDLMRAQADYGKEFLDKVMSQADTTAIGLRQARTQEEGQLLGAQGQIAGYEQQARGDALQRLFLDSLRTGGLPPALQAAFAGTAGVTGDTVVYPK